MLKKTIKTLAFAGLCALALGMMATPHAKSKTIEIKPLPKKKTKISLIQTCACHHRSINYIGECANPDCPYYYGTLEW